MVYLELLGGLLLLIIGGDLLVRGAASTARHLGVSPMLIGITLVGFGTSTPELVASIQAALVGSPGIALGNVIGSNIANVLLILGVSALLRPIATDLKTFIRDGGMVALSAALCTAIVLTGTLSRVYGTGLIALLILYVLYTYRSERVAASDAPLDKPLALWLGVLFAVAGLVVIVLGARLLVFSAIDLAQWAGISESIVGLTVVAVGTSLPELVTGVIAAIRRQPSIAFGNVLGSNIYNILGIMGATALVQPITVPAEIASFDVWVMNGVTLLLVLFAVSGWRISRREGAILLAAYAGYVGYLAYTA
jgi:cation:H+ antiporter